ncbi:MAG: DUF308 domain-containing protein [Sphingosinicella sp.]|nr:DUF308 domain-containing protein [Sphingosinicella sp.]
MTDTLPDPESQAIAPTIQGKWVLIGLGVATLLLGIGAALLPLTQPLGSGSVVGWLLLLAGTFEITAGAVRGFQEVRKGRIAAGCVTAVAGLLFILNPLLGLFPTLYLVIAWLLIRGAILLSVAYHSSRMFTMSVAISGLCDMLLAMVLIVGLPLAVLVVNLFGPTPELVAHFAWIFAASFLVTGVSLISEPGFSSS